MTSGKFRNSAKSGYNKGTISADIRHHAVSKDVRRHRLISIDYIKTLCCHGRGREFESRRPRSSCTCGKFGSPVWEQKGTISRITSLPPPQQFESASAKAC